MITIVEKTYDITTSLEGVFTVESEDLNDITGQLLGMVDTQPHSDFFNVNIGDNTPSSNDGAGAAALADINAEALRKNQCCFDRCGNGHCDAFGNDIAAGQIDLENNTGIEPVSTLDPGSQGQGKSYQYVIDQDVKGVDVSIDVTFSFPGAGAQFTPETGAMLVILNPMEVIIGSMRASVDGVWVEVDDTNPIATLALGTYLIEEGPGNYVSAEVWAIDGINLLETNIQATLADNNSGAEIKADVTGLLPNIDGLVYLSPSAGDVTKVELDTSNFEVSVTASE